MTASPPASSPALRTEAALSLIEQAGLPAPEGIPGSAPWLQSLIDTLCQLSSRDALTGLANRRHFASVLSRELDRVARAGEPALLLMVDVDHFKSVNDRHGHATGDLVLKEVAQILLHCVRPMDTVARIGGEEFAVTLPNCPPAFGPMVAERMRARIERTPIGAGLADPIHVTVSLGGAFAPQWVRSQLALWLERADRQLYRAKQAGRNRVEIEPCAVSNVSAEEKRLLSAPLPAGPSHRASMTAFPAPTAHQARITAVTSGKGGVGKTFVSANLAAALAERGRRVLVLGADLGLANLDAVLDISTQVTLHDVFTGGRSLEEALTEVAPQFWVLLAGSGLVEYSRLAPEVRDKLSETLTALAPRFDHVLLDTGAGISDVVLYTVSLAEEVLLVTTPEPTSMTEAYAAIKVLAAMQARRRIGLVVNQATPGSEARTVRAQLQQVVDHYVSPALETPLAVELWGEVPLDPAARDAVHGQQLLRHACPGAPAARAFAALAAHVVADPDD